MKMLEQWYVTSLEDVGKLHIIDFNRLNGYWENNPARALKTIGSWLINRTCATYIECDLKQFPVHPGFQWEHVGNHEPLGQLYWNAFHNMFIGEIHFQDAPDFSGRIYFEERGSKPVHFEGDIGQVSASTFALDVLPTMHKDDIWISILDERHHLILEFLDDLTTLISKHMEKQYGLQEPKKRRAAIRKKQLSLFD